MSESAVLTSISLPLLPLLPPSLPPKLGCSPFLSLSPYHCVSLPSERNRQRREQKEKKERREAQEEGGRQGGRQGGPAD